MQARANRAVKGILGELPWTAELLWQLQGRKALNSRFSLKSLQQHLPEVLQQVRASRLEIGEGKRVLLFASLHYWIEEAAMLGLLMKGAGYRPSLAYLPYYDWQKPLGKLELRRNDLYARSILEAARAELELVPLLGYPRRHPLPAELEQAVQQVSHYDAQYDLQVEEVDTASAIYRLRLERNRFAAARLLALMLESRPDAVVVPNGTIQEMGVAYRVARYLRIPATTYEFSDQRDSIWLARNSEVMRQETGPLWARCRTEPLQAEQRQRIEAYYQAKMQGKLFENFVRPWQSSAQVGSAEVRVRLGLDGRPVVLLATNVLGDSLTLGRQVFSRTMAEWIERSVQYFAGREDVQLVVRVHPGETLTHGPSMVDVVHSCLPRLPDHIHLVGPRDPQNTYDLIHIADLGLVYTTTTGLEMALAGVPVVVAGATHYRGNGFTLDPESYPQYFELLDKVLSRPKAFRLTGEQVSLAWRYAHMFFFEYPLPFPWRLMHLWQDVAERPVSLVLGTGLARYGRTLRALAGEPFEW